MKEVNRGDLLASSTRGNLLAGSPPRLWGLRFLPLLLPSPAAVFSHMAQNLETTSIVPEWQFGGRLGHPFPVAQGESPVPGVQTRFPTETARSSEDELVHPPSCKVVLLFFLLL